MKHSGRLAQFVVALVNHAIELDGNSASLGIDGLLYAAWRAARSAGAKTLCAVASLLAQGSSVSHDFNHNVAIFLHKGDLEGDSSEISRKPEDTRPLSLKNTDNKIICSIYNNACKRYYI